MRLAEGGYFSRKRAGRTGRGLNSPPQLGQAPPRRCSAQVLQKVHSKVQIMASVDVEGRSLSQHSQLGRISNMSLS